MPAQRNVLVIMSDEHNPKYLGAAGHPYIQTPNLDALAARGTRFTSAYTTCPICVPARAAFAVGRYVHEIGFWDNGDAYDGSVPSWHHALRAGGRRAVSIGKLHFRGQPGDDHGFTREIVPMHVVEGIGDVKGLVRDDIPIRKGGDKMAKYAGPGESTYTVYDRDIASRAQIWLHEEGTQDTGAPWVLFVSFVAPHFPLTAPPEWFYRYAGMNLPMPKQYRKHERPRHPAIDEYARVVDYDTHFTDENDVRRALAGYAGLVSAMDENVGKVLRALGDAGLANDTAIIYTSDHGDNTGARGLWGKSTFYEESAGVPMIVAGPGLPSGKVVDVPVSHVDCAPAILDAAGATPLGPLSGHSLFDIANGATPAPPGALRVSRDRLIEWRVHVAPRSLQVLPLRRTATATIRSRPGSRGARRPCERRRARGHPARVRSAATRCAGSGGRRCTGQGAAGLAAENVRRPREGAGAWRPGFHACTRHAGRARLTRRQENS